MGGIGSGRWRRTGTKTPVEHCLHLDINEFIRAGLLRPGATGFASWFPPGLSISRQRIAFAIQSDGLGGIAIQLAYGREAADVILQTIPIRRWRLPDGRRVRRFECPAINQHELCGITARKLYAADAGFGCRQCLSLAYLSSQTAHGTERLIRQLRALRHDSKML